MPRAATLFPTSTKGPLLRLLKRKTSSVLSHTPSIRQVVKEKFLLSHLRVRLTGLTRKVPMKIAMTISLRLPLAHTSSVLPLRFPRNCSVIACSTLTPTFPRSSHVESAHVKRSPSSTVTATASLSVFSQKMVAQR